MTGETNQRDIIDLSAIFRKIYRKKLRIAITALITGIIASILIVQVPRYYSSEVALAPEMGGTGLATDAIGSIATSFGFDLGMQQTSDAIYPMLYPDLFESTDFVVKLFDIEVETIDGSVKTNYYDYLANYQESAPWQPAIRWIKNLLKQKAKTRNSKGGGGDNGIDPFMLTERQSQLVESVKSNIKCTIDKKTDVIKITVKDQDPLISATLVESVRQRLQKFITEYRTSKARSDYEYYEKLTQEALEEYNKAIAVYSEYSDNHRNAILQAYISERDNLENDMQVKFNAYNALNTQLQAAKAKIQESTPAFTILQSASVPIKAAGPKRMIFVLGMMLLAAFVASAFYVRKEIFTPFNDKEPEESHK